MRSFEERHGHPPGLNAVTLATDESHGATDALVSATTAGHVRKYGLVRIDGEEPAMVFANDVGGHLFALADSGRVWRSTTASWSGQFDLAAGSLQQFLEELAQRISMTRSPGG